MVFKKGETFFLKLSSIWPNFVMKDSVLLEIFANVYFIFMFRYFMISPIFVFIIVGFYIDSCPMVNRNKKVNTKTCLS